MATAVFCADPRYTAQIPSAKSPQNGPRPVGPAITSKPNRNKATKSSAIKTSKFPQFQLRSGSERLTTTPAARQKQPHTPRKTQKMPEHTIPTDREAALAIIRTAMIEKKMTQAELADAADCHEKTIQNLMAGRSVRAQTLFDVCMVLGLEFEHILDGWSGNIVSAPMELKGEGGLVAPVYMGAYTRAATDHYIGTYLTLRPSFSKPNKIVAYRTQIVWDPEWPSLLFEEHERPDAQYSHRGRIYVPASSMFIHLVSLTKGAMRMIMVSQIDQAGQMRGLITTLNRQGAQLIPVSAPIVYVQSDEVTSHDLGELASTHPKYKIYSRYLEETLNDGFARLVPNQTIPERT